MTTNKTAGDRCYHIVTMDGGYKCHGRFRSLERAARAWRDDGPLGSILLRTDYDGSVRRISPSEAMDATY